MTRVRRNLVYAGRNLLGSHRAFELLLVVKPGVADRMTRRDAAVCIEGFPRSGNTFAGYAFVVANPGVRVAHHVHVPSQVLRAVRFGVPCAVLVRRPIDALTSLSVQSPALAPSVTIRSYINFHRRVRPVRDHVVVCEFDDVVADPWVVVDRLNTRYGTAFQREPPPDGARRADLFAAMSAGVREAGNLPVPSEEKERRKGLVRAAIESHPLLAEADRLYDEWSAAAQAAR